MQITNTTALAMGIAAVAAGIVLVVLAGATWAGIDRVLSDEFLSFFNRVPWHTYILATFWAVGAVIMLAVAAWLVRWLHLHAARGKAKALALVVALLYGAAVIVTVVQPDQSFPS